MAYLGQVRKSLERSKVNPRSSLAGTVLIRFTVGPAGDVLSRVVQKSSGSKLLDDAAMASLDRAAPFPAMPQDLARGPLEVQVLQLRDPLERRGEGRHRVCALAKMLSVAAPSLIPERLQTHYSCKDRTPVNRALSTAA
jgi:TonB family protein